MSNYVDGFVVPVPKQKLGAYRRIAAKACKIWLEHGALDYKECVVEDATADFALSFAKGIKARPRETVILAYIVYKSRRHRDRVNAAVMKDPRIAALCDPADMPFDCKRMLYGGFKVIVSG